MEEVGIMFLVGDEIKTCRNLFNRFGTVNKGVTAFVTEMKAQGIWGNGVVLASQSDFARTLDPNANLEARARACMESP